MSKLQFVNDSEPISSSINRISHATINSPIEEDFLETLLPFNGIEPDRADGLRVRRG
jgi:hypothetical protein